MYIHRSNMYTYNILYDTRKYRYIPKYCMLYYYMSRVKAEIGQN